MKKLCAIVTIAILLIACCAVAYMESEVEGEVADYEKVVIVEAASDNAQQNNKVIHAIDGDILTRWCAELYDDTGAEIVLTFDKEYSFNTLFIAFNKPQTRSYRFTAAISLDGENWEMISEEPFDAPTAFANGEFSEVVLPETVTAKYLKFVGYGYTDLDTEEWFGGATDPNNGGPLSWFSFWEINIPVVEAPVTDEPAAQE